MAKKKKIQIASKKFIEDDTVIENGVAVSMSGRDRGSEHILKKGRIEQEHIVVEEIQLAARQNRVRGGPRNSDRVLRWNPPLKTEGNYGYDQEKKSQPCLQGEGRVRGFAGRKNAVRAIGAIRGSREPDQHMEEAIIEGFA